MKNQVTVSHEKNEQSEKIVERYLECLKNQNYKEARTLLKHDFKHNLDRNKMETGINNCDDAINHAREVGSFDYEMVDIFSCGNKVAGRYICTVSSDHIPKAKPGEKVKVEGIMIAYIENGQIAEVWHQQDMLGLFIDLGMIPQPVNSF